MTVALGAVACGHVADLVGDHACKLRLVIGECHQAARNMDVTAGQSEGIDLGGVEDDEGEGRFRLLGGQLKEPAETRDVALKLWVLIETAEGLHQLRMLVGADTPLFLGRHEGGELLLAGRRIDVASAEQERRGHRKHETQRHSNGHGRQESGPYHSRTSICSGWVASIMGPLNDSIQPRTRTRRPS